MAASVIVKFDQPPPGVPFETWAQVINHLNKSQNVEVSGVSEYVIAIEGSLPEPNDRNLPILVTDADGNLLYWAKYVAAGDACCNEGEVCPLCCAEVGELKTLFPTESTMALEVQERKLFKCGWALADGDGAGAGFPDLTGDSNYFGGSAPNWDRYTVVYVGSSS